MGRTASRQVAGLIVAGVFALIPAAKSQSAPQQFDTALYDLSVASYYQKKNATVPEYSKDWHDCGKIARGELPGSELRSPQLSFNPLPGNGVLGSLISEGMYIQEVIQANIKMCLLVKGWTFVETPKGERKRIYRLTKHEQLLEMERLMGSDLPSGAEYLSFNNAWAAPDFVDGGKINERLLKSLREAQKDRTAPRLVPTPMPAAVSAGSAILVIGVSRVGEMSMLSNARVIWAPYDAVHNALVGDPAKWFFAASDPGIDLEYLTLTLPEGDYVLFSTGQPIAGGLSSVDYCMGAPMIHVTAGQAFYFGDITPSSGVVKGNFTTSTAAYSSNLTRAREHLAGVSPLARSLAQVAIRNGAVYPCTGLPVSEYRIPSVGN
jgi:hypothetical protein